MAESLAVGGGRASQHATSTGGREQSGVNASSPAVPVFRSDIFSMKAAAGIGGGNAKGQFPVFGSFTNPGRLPVDRPLGMPGTASSSFSDAMYFGNNEARPAPAIMIRRLSRNISSEALGSMLIFAGDLIDTEFIRSPYPEDQGYATAVARFRSQSSALEAQQKLHGKPNTTKDASLIVEVHSSSMASPWDRRNTVDGSMSRVPTSSTSSSNGSFSGSGGRSRFNSTFQSNDKNSPPLSTSNGSTDLPIPENSMHFQNLFSPQSPLNNGFEDRLRVSGKSMINDDAVDDETGELLKDPVAYAKNGQQSRRPTSSQQQLPISRFGSLSLSTNLGNNNVSVGIASRALGQMPAPISPNSLNGGPPSNDAYAVAYTRPQYPPVNPADQNPPCNTLYVGNLPLDTSEDELKAVFSKQRGYKRLCFRTKQNGPMCFVEFDDISFATKALNELYGHPLHNSVKGGIRLSFSKNPLGVRSGQNTTAAPPAQHIPSVYGHFIPSANFSSVSGPPPGLSGPPGANGAGSYRTPTALENAISNPFGMHLPDFASSTHRSVGVQANANFGGHGHSGFSDNFAFH